MSSMKEYFEGMSYRELQKIAKGLKVPANLKKNYLVDVITAKKGNNEELVKRITGTAYKERQEHASTKRTKKPTTHSVAINLGQSRIAPRDPYIILTDNNYNTRQTRSRHKTIQHYQPTVQCTNLSSMHMLSAGSSNIGIRYNTVQEKNYTNNLEQNSNSIPHLTRKPEGGKQKETMLEALLKAPMSSNIGDVLADSSQDDMIDCVGLDDDDVMPTRESNNSKSQWISGTVYEDNNFMDSQQNLNQSIGSIESGSSLSTRQVLNAKAFEVDFKVPHKIKNNKRLFCSRQMQKDKGSASMKKFKPHDYDNSSQDILKSNQNIAKELGLQLDNVNSNVFSEDYTSPLNQNSDNSNTFIHGGGIGNLNDPGLSGCYLSNYNASSSSDNYHNYTDDEGFFSHNLSGDIDHINPPLTTIDHSMVHAQNLEQNNYNLFNYDSLTQSEELFDMLESENENNSSFANNTYSSNICSQNQNDNIMDMDIDYDASGFNPLSGSSIIISEHSIRPLKRETLSQESNDSRNEVKLSCSIKSSVSAAQGLPMDQIMQENLVQYGDFMLSNAVSQNDSLSFSNDLPIVESFTSLNPDNNNMSLARIQERSSALGMMDEDIPIADDRETSQPAAQATDLMNFYRKYGRWEEPYKPMKGTATAMLCFLCNWFGMVANFDDHLRKCHLDQICHTFQGMVMADVNLGVLASGTMLHRQQIIIEHGHHLFVLRFKFKPPDTVCALMLVVPPKGLATVSDPFPAIVHIQAISQDTRMEVVWSGPIDCLNQPNRPTNIDIFANRCNGRFEVMMREINIVPENLPENEIDLEGLTLAVNVYIQTLEDLQKANKQKSVTDAAKIIQLN